jgi:hypothetical protein
LLVPSIQICYPQLKTTRTMMMTTVRECPAVSLSNLEIPHFLD